MKLDITETTRIIQHTRQSTYDDNQEIIWPTTIGIFVALALGWMICRYKCSSQERSPHVVRCCPKSLCKRIRLCCIWTFSLFRYNNESHRQQNSSSDLRIQINKERISNQSLLEIPFMENNSTTHHSSSLTQSFQQWPQPFLLNNNQEPSFPLSISIQSTINSSQPKRHPLRLKSISTETEHSNERRYSSPCPFRATNMDFHEQTNNIKQDHLFFNT
ncbi:unnamed protein product [Rotaria sordida]|uniref:Uncharacterized protein n=1 Tax=Rotaria sordida TaxID=392033 RepID=A0A813SRN5_9BILA|nr:unnamed protein product [Rotaria sordida]CAF0768818.1 unnamed protein product [Rotaria sordida]CAF0801289.1 unnamed protein product [Rotaria sordida]